MSWLSKIFNYVPTAEREGISIGKEPAWLISCSKNLPLFLRALEKLVPPASVLYIEGVPPSDIQSFFEIRKPEQITKIAMGTIWPRPKRFHMLINADNLEGLAQLAEKHHMLEIAEHLHVYNGNRIILQWYDAFTDSFYISKEISEDKIKQFCEKLELTYKEERSY